MPKPFVCDRGSRGKLGSADEVEYARGAWKLPDCVNDGRACIGVEERDGRRSGSTGAPGGANSPMNGSEPFGIAGGRTFSELDGLRLEEPEGVLLRDGSPSLEGVGPREGWRTESRSSPRGRSDREARESRSLPPSERFWSETMRRYMDCFPRRPCRRLVIILRTSGR